MDIATLGLKIDASGAIQGIDRVVSSLSRLKELGATSIDGFADDLRQTALGAQSATSAIDGLESAASSAGLGEVFEDAAEQAKEFGDQTDRAKKKTDDLSGSMDGLRKLLATVGIGLLAREYMRLSDVAKLTEGSLRALGLTGVQLADAQRRLQAIASETRGDFAELSTLYVRTARATRDLGVSQEAVYRVMTAVSKAAVVSNASQAEAAGSFRQLSQAFASGVLRGEELNSVMEQLPRIADALATDLGVTTGELRRMALAGELTSERVFKALLNQAPRISEEFATMAPTIGQAATTMQNAFVTMVANIESATGISATFAKGVMELSQNVPLLTAVVGTTGLAGAIGVLAVAAFKLNAALAAGTLVLTPWIAGFAALASSAAAVYQVLKLMEINKQIKETEEYTAKLNEQVKARNALSAAGMSNAEVNAALTRHYGANLIAAKLAEEGTKKLTKEQLEAIKAQKEAISTLREQLAIGYGDKEQAIAIKLERELAKTKDETQRALLKEIALQEVLNLRRERAIELAKLNTESERALAAELKASQARLLNAPIALKPHPEETKLTEGVFPPEKGLTAWQNFIAELVTEWGVSTEAMGNSMLTTFTNIVTRGKASFSDLFAFLGGTGLGSSAGKVGFGIAATLAEVLLGGKERAKAAREALKAEIEGIADAIDAFTRSFGGAMGAFRSELQRIADTYADLSERTSDLLTVTARRALDAAGGDVDKAIANLSKKNKAGIYDQAIAQLTAYREQTDKLTQAYKDATAAAKEAQERRRAEAKEDNEVRRLRAMGQNDEADRLAMEIRFRREIADARREELDLVSLAAAQAAEWAAFIADGIKKQQDAERTRQNTIKSLEADILSAQGDTKGADAIRRQIERDKIMVEVTDELIRAKYEELWALQDAARAAQEVADALALLEKQTTIAEDYEVRRLTAMGKTTEAEELRFRLGQERELRQAKKDLLLGNITQELYDTLVEILGIEATSFGQRNMVEAASPLASGASDTNRQTGGTIGAFASAQVQDIDRVVGELTTIRIRMGQLVQYMARFTRGGGVVGAVNGSLQRDTEYQQIVNGNIILS